MADPDAELNGDTHLSKEVTKGGDAVEPMDTEDADTAERPRKPAVEAMETEENGDVTDTPTPAPAADAGVDEVDAAPAVAADGDKAAGDADANVDKAADAEAEGSAEAAASDNGEEKDKGDEEGDDGKGGDVDEKKQSGDDAAEPKNAEKADADGDKAGDADAKADDSKAESVGDTTDANTKDSANGDVSEESASRPAPEKRSAAPSEADGPSSAACTEPESTDSDIEEIEPPDPLSIASPAASSAPSRDSPRLVVIDSDTGRPTVVAASAAQRPPPLHRAPPPQQSHHQQHYQQQQYGTGATVTINPAVLQALAQYGINTSGMSAEHLAQLQDYYRRSHDDAEFVLEAPSFIVPYVMESPAEETVKQFMRRVTKEGDAAAAAAAGKKDGEETEGKVNGDVSKTASETESDDQSKKDGEGTDKEQENKENKPDSGRKEEDFSHLGKWAYYYQAPVGQLLLDQGRGIVEEFIKEDLLKQQKKKAAREKGGGSEATRFAIKSLTANLAASRKRNAPFRLKMTQCRYCAFETESILVMERHLEMPHMVGSIYQCNFCDYETRSPQVVLSHMMEEHSVQGRLERAPASFQCPLCPYEDSGKARMTRHLNSCQKKFRIEKNQSLDDWVPPAKVPKVHRGRPNVLGKQFEPVRGLQSVSRAALQQQQQQQQQLQQQQQQQQAAAAAAAARRGRPVGSYKDGVHLTMQQRHQYQRQGYVSNVPGAGGMSPSMVRPPASGGQMLMPPHYQIGNQIYQLVNNQLVPVNPSSRAGGAGGGSGVQIIPSSQPAPAPSGLSIQATSTSKTVAAAALKLSSTPSISITPVPRPSLPPSVPAILRSTPSAGGSQLSITKGTVGAARSDAAAVSKGAFVICEICDGYIKDLEQLRNHMQWIHKVKIHPKMIYNRPPLNCQKCQLRFFTDQGLERHLLGSHGLVTSSMQEAANKGHDSGRCPICGKVYQWKLLHHVSKDHHVTLKPAHLSYKCTVCTATFSMYKQFENHVYSSHSVVAKKIMESSDRKKAAAAAAASGQPIKINDEITIIPHPGSGSSAAAPQSSAPSGAPRAASTPVKRRRPEPAPAPVERECDLCEHRALPAPLIQHYRDRHLGRPEVEFTPLLRDPECAEFVTEEVRQQLKGRAAAAAESDSEIEVEVSDPEDESGGKTGSGGGALSKLNKEITITPIATARPRRVVTVRRPKPFVGPACARRQRRARLAPRSVAERRRADRQAAERRRNPSVVELSDSEPATADNTVDLETEEEEEKEEQAKGEVEEVGKEEESEAKEGETEAKGEDSEKGEDAEKEEETEPKEEEVEKMEADESKEEKMEEDETKEEDTDEKMDKGGDSESGSAGGSGAE